jgi:diguanylate cyclase (GGDEF)-like protein
MSSILVVEAEGTITSLLKAALEINSYQTVTVLNGGDAVQFVLREIPHLIVIDLLSPGLDGYGLIRRLRDHPKCMHIPILVVGRAASRAEKIHAFELGIDGYITRPIDADELLAYVRRQLCRMQQTSLSPLTQLPGGLQLERAIDYKLCSMEPWSILYLDFDHFKAFNDAYGFLAGNDMIILLSRICQGVVYEYGNAEDFVGHIGGDDFLILTTPDRATVIYRQILERYKHESKALYRPEDIQRGSISAIDCKGCPYDIPLVSLSIGIVSDQWHYPRNVVEIGTLVAQAKRLAKQSPENVYQISDWALLQRYLHSSNTFPAFSSKVNRFPRSLLRAVQEDSLAKY